MPRPSGRSLADLARRAYRRPVTDEEVDELVKLVAMVQKDGDSFEEGLCLAIQRMLISPHFLFRVEKAPADGVATAQPARLATRLSYFLWSSMPDEELLRCADEGKLREPGVLEAQVRRMLKDAKARALVENFGGQWLQTRALESHTARPHQVPGVHRLHAHVDEEGDGPVLRARPARGPHRPRFLDADYTFLNQRLAEFYGIPGVKGTSSARSI